MRFNNKTTTELLRVVKAGLGFIMLTARKSAQITFIDSQAIAPAQLKSILLKS